MDDIFSKITNNVGAAIKATNKALPTKSQRIAFHYNRKNPKRRRFSEPTMEKPIVIDSSKASTDQEVTVEEERKELIVEQSRVVGDNDEGLASLSNMVAVLCQEHLFLPLLRAFEMFLPSCTLVPFIRSLQVSHCYCR